MGSRRLFLSVQTNIHVSYPNPVLLRIKYIGYIGKEVLNSHLGYHDPCYVQNPCYNDMLYNVTCNIVKRFWCTSFGTMKVFSSKFYT